MNIKVKKSNSRSNNQITASTEPKNKYDEAIDYIKCAISALSVSAKDNDTLARESIANLSVVLMDLK